MREIVTGFGSVNQMQNQFYFDNSGPDPHWHRGFTILQKVEILALIRVISELRPDFTKGNQYRESLNLIYKAKIDHLHGINEAIINIALNISKLPPSLEAKVSKFLPTARKGFNEKVRAWLVEEGGTHE